MKMTQENFLKKIMGDPLKDKKNPITLKRVLLTRIIRIILKNRRKKRQKSPKSNDDKPS